MGLISHRCREANCCFTTDTIQIVDGPLLTFPVVRTLRAVDVVPPSA